jgi:hypothetical protein
VLAELDVAFGVTGYLADDEIAMVFWCSPGAEVEGSDEFEPDDGHYHNREGE